MKIQLIQYTPNPEEVIAAAAKLCYSQTGIDGITKNLTPEKTSKFVKMLMGLGHQSPLEHVSFTFGIEGVSRVLTHQLVRHRIASYSQQSQRYVKLDQFQYIIPPYIDEMPEAKELFIKAMEEDQRTYNKLADILFNKHYNKFIKEGKTEKEAKRQAEKKAIEDARFVFPNACETKIVVTMNARTLIHFFKHRCCNRAQWEIRDLATEMLKLVKEVAPNIFKDCGPNCITGPCPEGKMTCGLINEVREKFNNI